MSELKNHRPKRQLTAPPRRPLSRLVFSRPLMPRPSRCPGLYPVNHSTYHPILSSLIATSLRLPFNEKNYNSRPGVPSQWLSLPPFLFPKYYLVNPPIQTTAVIPGKGVQRTVRSDEGEDGSHVASAWLA